MAKQLKKEHLINEHTIFLVVLPDGVWFASKLFDALGDIPNEVHFIKGHFSQDQEQGEFVWDLKPDTDFQGCDVVIIDDICDTGETLRNIVKDLHNHVQRLIAVTLLKRVPSPSKIGIPVYACIEDESKDFFVGCGLDDNGRGRLLRQICIC